MRVSVEKANSLVHIVVEGSTTIEEMRSCIANVRTAFDSMKGAPFVVLVDLRQARAAASEVADGIRGLQEYAMKGGMQKSAHVLNNATTVLQLNRISKESGAYDRVRRFASEADARAWLLEDMPGRQQTAQQSPATRGKR